MKTTATIRNHRFLAHLSLVPLATLLLALTTTPTYASDPVGIYAFVDKVVLEPSEGIPDRIQIWGGFALAEGSGQQYASAKRGYMYFRTAPGKEHICRKEWNDLKSIAGSGQIIGLGTRYEAKGTVRSPEAKPENPEVYPLGFGLQKVPATANSNYAPLKELRALQAKREVSGTTSAASTIAQR